MDSKAADLEDEEFKPTLLRDRRKSMKHPPKKKRQRSKLPQEL